MVGHKTGPSKSKRVPFTKKDDAVLAKWVLSKQNSGGNKIYQELEKMVCCRDFVGGQIADLALGRTVGIHGSHGGAAFSTS